VILHELAWLFGPQNTRDPLEKSEEVYGMVKPYNRKNLDPESLLGPELPRRAV
jgi:hypothetical protein